MTNLVKPKRESFGTYLDKGLSNRIQLLQLKRKKLALKTGENSDISMTDLVNEAIYNLLDKEGIK